MRRSAVVLAVAGAAGLGLILASPPNVAAPTRASNSSSTGDFSSAPYATVRHGVRRAAARGPASRVWTQRRRINVPIGRLRIKAIGLDAPIRNGIHNRVVRLVPVYGRARPCPARRATRSSPATAPRSRIHSGTSTTSVGDMSCASGCAGDIGLHSRSSPRRSLGSRAMSASY